MFNLIALTLILRINEFRFSNDARVCPNEKIPIQSEKYLHNPFRAN